MAKAIYFDKETEKSILPVKWNEQEAWGLDRKPKLRYLKGCSIDYCFLG
jgi:hypothetical protein